MLSLVWCWLRLVVTSFVVGIAGILVIGVLVGSVIVFFIKGHSYDTRSLCSGSCLLRVESKVRAHTLPATGPMAQRKRNLSRVEIEGKSGINSKSKISQMTALYSALMEQAQLQCNAKHARR